MILLAPLLLNWLCPQKLKVVILTENTTFGDFWKISRFWILLPIFAKPILKNLCFNINFLKISCSILNWYYLPSHPSLRRGVRSDAQLSSTETRFQKCSQSGKNGSKHQMLSISMAFNVISCKKVERNTQKLKIADFTM